MVLAPFLLSASCASVSIAAHSTTETTLLQGVGHRVRLEKQSVDDECIDACKAGFGKASCRERCEDGQQFSPVITPPTNDLFEGQFRWITQGTCHDAGMLPITDETMCKDAADALMTTAPQRTIYKGQDNKKKRPFGCYIQELEQVRFNTNEKNVDNGATGALGDSRSKFRYPICQNQLQQYTPTQSDHLDTFWDIYAPDQSSHAPDGVLWLGESAWNNAEWDGTVYDPSVLSRVDFASAICPTGDTIRGARELFYKHQPWANNSDPTWAQVDNWHRLLLNHLRALVGYTDTKHMAEPDHCLFARALWGNQRQRTQMWDEAHPGPSNCAGPCLTPKQCGSHCGSTFFPSATEQEPYLADRVGTPAICGFGGGGAAEGITSAPKARVPWSIKMSRGFCSYLEDDGFWSGHASPFFHRQKFGFSFWDISNQDGNALLRAKWGGNLERWTYTCDPTKHRCSDECDAAWESCTDECSASNEDIQKECGR